MTESQEKSMTDLLSTIHVNGVDAATGDYAVAPASSEQWARIINGEADRGVAHATQGPCLQQYMVGVLEGE